MAGMSGRRDLASPRRMGAALTYARRYALFTLVGIAGEDDLDAPDLCLGGPSQAAASTERPVESGIREGQARGLPAHRPRNGNARGALPGHLRRSLDPEQSAALRIRLLAELESLSSANLAVTWARAALPAKNGLTASDAKLVEDAFERRLAELPSPEAVAHASDDAVPLAPLSPPTASLTAPAPFQQTTAAAPDGAEPADPSLATGIDKSVLTIAAPRRYRNRDHLRFVAQQRSSAAASRRTPIICAGCSQRRSAASRAMSSPCRSAASTIAQCTAPVTSWLGGRPPVSIRSWPPVSCGSRRA